MPYPTLPQRNPEKELDEEQQPTQSTEACENRATEYPTITCETRSERHRFRAFEIDSGSAGLGPSNAVKTSPMETVIRS